MNVAKRIALTITVAGAAAVLPSPVPAGEGASRLVDLTYSCEAGFLGGLRQITIFSAYTTAEGSSKLRASSTVVRNRFDSLGSLRSDGVTIHRGNCVPAKNNVKLTTKGLRGGAVPPLGAEVTCETPRRLLLRVRASFAQLVSPRVSRQFGYPLLTAMGELEEAAIALATPAGKPIAYTAVTGEEKARLFTQRSCRED